MTRLAPDRVRLRVYVVDPLTNKGRQVSKTIRVPTRITQKALEEHLRKFHGELTERRASGTTAPFGRLLDDWLADLERQGKSKTTIDTYSAYVKNRIRPRLGDVRLNKLTARHLDQLYAELQTDGLAIRTIRLVHAIIRSALTQARKWGWVVENVAVNATPPKLERSDPDALPVADLATVLRAAEADDPDMAVAIALAAVSGARRGELCGLKWTDVDWNAMTIRIERAWVAGVGGQHLTTTKTKVGRTTFIGPVGVGLLEAHRSRKVEEFGDLVPGGWILSAGDGTKPMRPMALTQYVTDLSKKHGVDLHLHGLRHFAASEMLGAGVDIKTAASMLGHSPAILASTYAHSSDERKQAAAALLGAVVQKALTP